MRRPSFLNRIRAHWEKCVSDGAAFGAEPDDLYEAEYNHDEGADLTQYLYKVRYQGSVPSCVSFGIGHAIQMRIGWLKARGRPIPDMKYPSESWIYYFGRRANGDVGVPLTGVYITKALDMIREHGYPPLRFRKYSTSAKKLNKRPTGKQTQQAHPQKGVPVRYIRENRIQSVVSALERGYPVVFGTQVIKAMRNYNDEILTEPSKNEPRLGGHCMCISGYKIIGGRYVFDVVNSWRGREMYQMDESFILWNQTRNLAVIDV